MELTMPNKYVEIGNEEMMYVDGGWKVYTNWWGLSLKLTKKECQYVAAGGNFATLIGGQYAPLFAVGAGLASFGAAGRGMWINRPWLGHIWVTF